MIRELEKKDIPFILDIYNYYIKNTTITFETEVPPLNDFEERLLNISKAYPFIVCEIDGKIIGYAYLDHFNPRKAYDCTADLSIYLDHRSLKKGYGKQLMSAIINKAKELGYWNIVSIITSGNENSERIHSYFGFEKMVTFSDFGQKFNKSLAVSYYVLRLKEN